MGKANGSREYAPDDKLRVPTIQDNDLQIDGGHGAKSAFAHPTHRCSGYVTAVRFG